MKMPTSLLIWFMFCFFTVTESEATQLMPWFGPDKLIEVRETILYQHYRDLDTRDGNQKKHAYNTFLNTEIAISPSPSWSVEGEFTIANTAQHPSYFDSGRLTGRYLIFNDVIGDPVSLAVGLTFIQASHQSVEDISSFHHGTSEGEAHLAIGKEFSCGQFWTSRYWGVVRFGTSNLGGSPWLRADFSMEKNWWDTHHCRLFLESLFGLGKDSLSSEHHFNGYRSLNHQSVDLGIRYTYLYNKAATLSLGYICRVYGQNFPVHSHALLVSLLFNIGL